MRACGAPGCKIPDMTARVTWIVLGLLTGSSLVAGQQQPAAQFADLLTLANDVASFRRSPSTEPADFAPASITSQRSQLTQLQARHAAIDASAWSVSDRVDHILVGAQLADLDFTYRVVVPWERDPNHYVDLIRRIPYAATPIPPDRREAVLRSLRSVPTILAEAQRRLTRPSAELARMAIFALEQSDEVNQGEPRRPRPPAGVIGWFEDLAGRLPSTDRELTEANRAAIEATRAYRDWLSRSLPAMREPAGFGLTHYEWYLRHVRLIPLTVAQVQLIGDRELARGKTLLAIERHRNAGLPELTPASTAEDHERRTRDAEQLIRNFITARKLISIPDYIPASFETDAFFIDRSPWGGHRHFWDEITYRDPLNNHIHASIPGPSLRRIGPAPEPPADPPDVLGRHPRRRLELLYRRDAAAGGIAGPAAENPRAVLHRPAQTGGADSRRAQDADGRLLASTGD